VKLKVDWILKRAGCNASTRFFSLLGFSSGAVTWKASVRPLVERKVLSHSEAIRRISMDAVQANVSLMGVSR
jgi:hypothetical protein